MSFLAPLYMLGLFLVSLPVLAHLLQRRPRRVTQFSSLMFLEESPPKITRRSRISNWLLLALRTLAITLLSLAFARPFLRDLRQVNTDLPARNVAILLDQSASMRQGDVWNRAHQVVEDVLQGLGQQDDVALFTFDETLQTVVPPRPRSPQGRQQQIINVRQAAKELQPSWYGTRLGPAFAGLIDQYQTTDEASLVGPLHIVVISDVQVGMDLGSLTNFSWPEHVSVDVRGVTTNTGNAFAQRLPSGDDPANLRLRVTNSEQSKNHLVTLVTRTADGEEMGAPLPIQVLPGRSRVVTMQRPTESSVILLQGDEESFDNQTYVAVGRPETKTVLYVGDLRDTPESMYYFLKRVNLGSPLFPIQIEGRDPATTLSSINPQETPLLIFSEPPPDGWASALQGYLRSGGRVLVTFEVPQMSGETERLSAPCLASLLEVDQLEFEYVEAADHGMWTEVDFESEVFQRFAQPGFNDFTKIRFWKYWRPVTDHEHPWTVIARYEDGVPALTQRDFGPGRLWVLTTGWVPSTSQLALSTKFVPLLAAFLGETAHRSEHDSLLHVGDRIDVSQTNVDSVTTPSGQVTTIRDEHIFDATESVGLYTIRDDQNEWQVAINLSAAESRTEPTDVTRLESLGVPIGPLRDTDERVQDERQMQSAELESDQQIWRWIIVFALALLAVETYLAGRAGQRPSMNFSHS